MTLVVVATPLVSDARSKIVSSVMASAAGAAATKQARISAIAGGRRNGRVTRWIILFAMRRLSTLAVVFVLFVSAAASAQGLVTGVVKDTNQRPIKGATIT